MMSNNELTSQDKPKCLSCENCKCQKDEYLTDLQIDGINTILKRNDVECYPESITDEFAEDLILMRTNNKWTITKIDPEKRENRVYLFTRVSKFEMKWKLIERMKWQD